jgi:uncharacterized protein (UPF0548 family)
VAADLNYDAVGATRPAEAVWAQHPAGYRRFERTVGAGHGPDRWRALRDAVMSWRIKTRSGFVVEPARRAARGVDYRLTARIGPLTVHEPVRVIDVVDEATRCGFAYGTRSGHPVSGEEAFIAHSSPDGRVWLTLRSLTRASDGRWRYAFPALLIAQRFYRRRYLRAGRS